MSKEYTDKKAMNFTVNKFSKLYGSTFGDPKYGIILAEGEDAGAYIPWRNAYAAAKKGENSIRNAVEKYSHDLPEDYS